MEKVANKNCREVVEMRQEFSGSNLRGVWRCERYYVVESYGWYPIFVYDGVDKVWVENRDKYSRSTSKQTSQARPMREKIILVSNETIKQLIA